MMTALHNARLVSSLCGLLALTSGAQALHSAPVEARPMRTVRRTVRKRREDALTSPESPAPVPLVFYLSREHADALAALWGRGADALTPQPSYSP